VSRERLAACLIVQDESNRLPAALASVAFCDEVIVVDGGSTDRTVDVARELGATVIENPWPGFARQRNVAIEASSADWILEVDADERITPTLRASIAALLAEPPNGAEIAVFALRNRFLGRKLGSSAKYPAYRARLFRRDVYRHDESRSVHEGIEPRSRPVVLVGDLDHELAATLGEALRDLWRYAQLESAHIDSASPTGYLNGIVLRPATKFVYRLAIDGGWRDGWQGALKISLDVISDALVWSLVLARRRLPGEPRSKAAHDSTGGHFGRRSRGAPRIVAIASGARAREQAARWLIALRAAGLDVALVSDVAPRGDESNVESPADPEARGPAEARPPRAGMADRLGEPLLPGQYAARLSPLATRRALEIEMDLRTIDAVIPVGRRARLMHRLLPPTLKPQIDGVCFATAPETVAALSVRE
jgi:Glycosyl transferase family 2